MIFTGERYLPTIAGRIKYEHLHRYALAAQLVPGKVVLDLACGEGYGAHLLAASASAVYGVDNSVEVIDYAARTYCQPNLYFLAGSCDSVPLEAASVDVAVSFETLEHHDKHEEMMQEIRRVLRPNGLLVISTPDRKTYSDEPAYNNPFHVKELYYHEFRALLRRHFKNVLIFGQRLAAGSFVHALDNAVYASWTAYGGNASHLAQGTHQPSSPLYFIALCSDRVCNIEASAINSVYLDPADDVLRQFEAETVLLRAETIQVNAEREAQKKLLLQQSAEIVRFNRELEDKVAEVRRLQERQKEQEGELLQQRHSLEVVTSNLNAIQTSQGWKALQRYHKIRDRILPKGGKRRRLLQVLWRTATGQPPLPLAYSSTTNSRLVTRPKAQPRVHARSSRAMHAADETEVTHVSVVIPTKNAGSLFKEVLSGLKKQEFEGTLDITVVDSGSRDNTLEIAEEFQARIIRVNPGSFDHGLTRNLGIEHVEGEVIVLLTQDAVPGTSHMVRHLVKVFADPAVAGVYGRQVPREDADVLTQKRLNEWLTGRMESQVVSLADVRDYDSLPPIRQYELSNFDNVCSAIRKSVWQDFPFRQNDFAEDLEWSKRVLQAGGKIAYEPAAFVVHSHRRSLLYEYNRTYICHRKLYKLFRLCTVPSRSSLIKAFPRGVLNDWAYVWRYEPAFIERIALLTKTPLLNLLTAYAQYVGARDEKELRVRRVVGI